MNLIFEVKFFEILKNILILKAENKKIPLYVFHCMFLELFVFNNALYASSFRIYSIPIINYLSNYNHNPVFLFVLKHLKFF